MRKLSSDAIYYKGLVGLIIGPVLIILFVKYIMVNNVPDLFKSVIYLLVLILIITQGRLLFKTRQVFYKNKTLILKTYFNKQSEDLLLTDIISLKKAFSLQKEHNRNLFKLTYIKDTKRRTIYFLKSLDIINIYDLEIFTGLNKLAK